MTTIIGAWASLSPILNSGFFHYRAGVDDLNWRILLMAVLTVTVAGQDVYLEVNWSPAEFVVARQQEIEFYAANGFDERELAFAWDFGDGVQATGETVRHAYGQSGRFRIRVIGTDNQGVQSQAYYATIFVNPDNGDPRVEAYITEPAGPVVIKAGETAHFAAGSDLPVDYFFWEVAGTDNTHIGTEFDFTVPRSWVDVYADIRLFAVNSDGFATQYPDFRPLYSYGDNVPPNGILVSPELVDGFYSAELGESIEFRAEGVDPDGTAPLEFFWTVETPSGNLTGEGSSFTLVAQDQGFYYGYVDVIDGDGWADPFPPDFNVWVRGDLNTPPEVWAAGGIQTVYAGETLTLEAGFYDEEGDEVTFEWELGDGRRASGASIDVSYPDPGAYRVVLTGTDTLGGANRYETWSLINPAIPTTNIEPYAAITSPRRGDMFASGTTVQFSGQGYDFEGGGVTFYWGFGDGVVAESAVVERVLECGAEDPCLLDVELFVRDDQGFFSWSGDYVAIATYDGDRPPDGVILEPAPEAQQYGPPVLQLRPGDLVRFRGDVVDGQRAGISAFWQFYQGDEFFQLDGFDIPAMAYGDFPNTGFWDVFFYTGTDAGLLDPVPDAVTVWVRDSNRPPYVEIAIPGPEVAIEPGETIELAAHAYDDDGDDVQLEWQISDGRRFTGDYVPEVVFQQAGLFSVSLVGRDGEPDGETRAFLNRYVLVNPYSEEDYPPSIIGLGPDAEQLVGPVGSRFTFSAAIDPDYPHPVSDWFWDLGNGQTSALASPGTAIFNGVGPTLARVFARSESGLWSTSPYTWSLYIYGSNVPPEGTIEVPALRASADVEASHTFPVLINTPIALRARAEDPDGDLPLFATWYVDGDPYSFALEPEPLIYAEKGSHWVDFYVNDANDLGDPFGDYRIIKSVDPALKPESYIVSPDGDITAEPGEELYFYGYGEDPNELDMTYQWEFGPEANITSAQGEEVDGVIFEQESPVGQPYEVRFTARTEFTEDASPAVVRVTVKSYQDEDFEPNDSLADAKDIQKGNYSNLSLDAASADQSDVFRFQVDENGRDLKIRLRSMDQQSPLSAELYYFDNGEWLPFGFSDRELNADTLVAENVPAGTYAVEIRAASSNKRRDGIPYGFGVSTQQPTLFLPFVVEDGVLTSAFSVLNPHDESVDLAISGLDRSGSIVETKTRTLQAQGRFRTESLSFFSTVEKVEQARSVVWLKVQSSHRLVGYMTAATLDKTQLFGSGGIGTLVPSLVVPHIAVRTDQWYTRAITIDGGNSLHPLDFVATDGTTEVTSRAGSNRQQDFRFSQMFEALPEWGRFVNRDGEATLAGVELFGRVDGARQVAALNFIYDRGTNPNFFQFKTSLFFPHVAKDTANFWTGISIINPGAAEAVLDIIGFDDQGTEIVRSSGVRLEAGGKILNTVAGIFPEASGISWLRVDTTEVLEGFELFGDHQNKRLAGFEAPRFATDLLFFPHLQVRDNEEWTGLTLLNVSIEPTEIQIVAMTDNGLELASTSRTLAPREKYVVLAQAVFPGGLPVGASYLKVTADAKSLVGFELFGSLQSGGLGEQMAGILALTP